MSSSISTAVSPLRSNGLHALTGRASNAMLTPTISSLMPTAPLPSQSPGHSAADVGLGEGVTVGVGSSAVAVTVGVDVGIGVCVALGVGVAVEVRVSVGAS
jgi:hypothetical protein